MANITIDVETIYQGLRQVEKNKLLSMMNEADGNYPYRVFAGEGSTEAVGEAYTYMGWMAKTEMVDLLDSDGYLKDVIKRACSGSVDDWYDSAKEGQREHMANKLLKHGYPKRSTKNRPTDLEDAVGAASLKELVEILKDYEIELEDIVTEYFR